MIRYRGNDMDKLQEQGRKAILPLVLIISLFFLWALANNLNDVLIGHFKKTFTLNDLQSGLVQSAFYAGYFFLAMPAAFFMRRFGYKAAVVLGLCLYGLGALLFFPAAQVREYGFFLGALFVIASGLAFLETAANPLMTVLGDPKTAERRLNFAQSFNSVGAITGAFIGTNFILTGVEHTPDELAAMEPAAREAFFSSEALAVQGPYLVLAAIVLVWAAAVFFTKFPAAATARSTADTHAEQKGGFGRLFANPHYVMGVVAQFFYVGAQVGVWSYLIRYAQEAVPNMGEKTAGGYLQASLVAFMIGRFAGTALMGKFNPEKLMGVFGVANVALCAVAIFVGGQVGLYALAATSFFMSIMFPTIFASAIRGLGPLTKIGSSFLIMAIIGGAVFTPMIGAISAASHIAYGMIVPAACFAFIAFYAFNSRPPAAVAAS
jgi:FHS family L-fucose permease-like MFS transporter